MKKYYKKILLLCGAAVMLSAMMLAGCASQPSASSDVSLSNDNKKLNVITSFYPMYDFAKKIGGEYVDVTNLVPEQNLTTGNQVQLILPAWNTPMYLFTTVQVWKAGQIRYYLP